MIIIAVRYIINSPEHSNKKQTEKADLQHNVVPWIPKFTKEPSLKLHLKRSKTANIFLYKSLNCAQHDIISQNVDN